MASKHSFTGVSANKKTPPYNMEEKNGLHFTMLHLCDSFYLSSKCSCSEKGLKAQTAHRFQNRTTVQNDSRKENQDYTEIEIARWKWVSYGTAGQGRCWILLFGHNQTSNGWGPQQSTSLTFSLTHKSQNTQDIIELSWDLADPLLRHHRINYIQLRKAKRSRRDSWPERETYSEHLKTA